MPPLKRAVAVVLVAAVALAAVVVLRGGSGSGRVDRAAAMLDDEDEFATSYEAADTLAKVGELLQAEGESCRGGSGDGDRCADLLAASAAAQVMAYRVLSCTAPGRFEARAAMAEHVDALADDRDPGEPPAPPTCR